MSITQEDWNLFRERLPGWQERYMAKLLKKYVEMLEGDEDASTRFWALEKKIKEDKRKPGVIMAPSKRDMDFDMARLMCIGAISEEDLDGFSGELKETVLRLYREWFEERTDPT